MTPMQMLAIATATLVALVIIIRKAMALDRASRAASLRDAVPNRPEPLRAEDLRVAQNAPL